jgi:hypothetical protein
MKLVVAEPPLVEGAIFLSQDATAFTDVWLTLTAKIDVEKLRSH